MWCKQMRWLIPPRLPATGKQNAAALKTSSAPSPPNPAARARKAKSYEGETTTAMSLLLLLSMPCCPTSSFWDSTDWKCRAMHRLKLLLPRWLSQLYCCCGLSSKRGVHLPYGSSCLLSAPSPPFRRAMNYPGMLKQTSQLFSQHSTAMALTIFWGTDRSQEKI